MRKTTLASLLALGIALLLVACDGSGVGGELDTVGGNDTAGDVGGGVSDVSVDVEPGGDTSPGVDTELPDVSVDIAQDVPGTPDAPSEQDVPSIPDVPVEPDVPGDPDVVITPPDAWAGDATVGGTPLDEVAIEWDGTLSLCSTWNEGSSLEEELARKVMVTLPPQERLGLMPDELEAMTLDGIAVVRGPLAGDRREGLSALASTLTDYTVWSNHGHTTLSATVQHDFGPAGTLREFFSVTRQSDDPRPVVIGSNEPRDRYEHEFWYIAPGGDPGSDGTRLAVCGDAGVDLSLTSSGELDPAVSVMAGRNGDRAVTVFRYWRTQETFAGSYPVVLDLHAVVFSDDEWVQHEVTGFWAQTYAAEHHNWFEATRLDFRRDVAAWYQVFGPLADGQPPASPELAEVTWREFDSWDADPSIEVIRVGTDGVEMTPETYEPYTGNWARVDAITLGRDPGFQCGGDVMTLGWGRRYLYQVLTCPRDSAPGFRVHAVVPVGFAHDMSVVGQTFGDDAVTERSVDGETVFAITLDTEHSPGPSIVELRTANGDGFIVKTLNAAGETADEFWSSPGELTSPLDWRTETMEGASADGAVSMRLVRQWAAQGVGESSIYAPVSFSLTFDGVTHEVVAWDRLDYTNTHHNWMDALTAVTADGWTLHWSFAFMEGGVHTVSAKDPTGAEALAPTPVELITE